jgi:DNA-binding NarL/FixJ family response regulator
MENSTSKPEAAIHATSIRRVLICEDHDALREDFYAILSGVERLQLLDAVSNGKAAIRAIDESRVDVLILDLGLPDMSGLKVLEHLRRVQVNAEALVVTVFADETSVLRAIEAGATGYVLKREASFSLKRRVEELLSGGSPITPSIARLVLSRLQLPSARLSESGDHAQGASVPDDLQNDTKELSTREIHVLQLVAKGLSVSEVGELLSLSSNTIKTYVRRIYKKLAVNSRHEAIFEARVLGLLGRNNPTP